MSPLHTSLDIEVCRDAADAIDRGYNYSSNGGREAKPLRVKKVVVVNYGTEAGLPTVDFLMEDEDGKAYIFFVTGRLLKSIPC